MLTCWDQPSYPNPMRMPLAAPWPSVLTGLHTGNVSLRKTGLVTKRIDSSKVGLGLSGRESELLCTWRLEKKGPVSP